MNDGKMRAGFVAIIGAPNAGKSTLMNQLVGQKIAIVSPKVQTTRVNMRGIVTRENTQFIFIDTPGIYRPGSRLLDRSMVQAAHQARDDADATVLMVDAFKGFNEPVMDIIEILQSKKPKNLSLVFNKVDKMPKEKLLPLMVKAQEMDLFDNVFAISATKGKGVEDILKAIEPSMPESPYLYSEDDVTDMPMRLLAAEITRERAFMMLNQELPYGLAVETVSYETEADGKLVIHQNILIEREAHKPIIVGKGGAMIKRIGEQARRNLQEMLQKKHLNLFLKVKVKANWSESSTFMQEIGLEPSKD